MKFSFEAKSFMGIGFLAALLTVGALEAKHYKSAAPKQEDSIIINNSEIPVFVVVSEAVEKGCAEKCARSQGKVLGGGVVEKGQERSLESIVGTDIDQCHLLLTFYAVQAGMTTAQQYVDKNTEFLDQHKAPYPFGPKKLYIVKSGNCCAKVHFICNPACCTQKCTRCCEKPCKPKCEKPCKPKCEKPCKPKCEKPCKPKCEKPCKPKCVKPCKPKCEKPCKPKKCSPCAKKPACAASKADDMIDTDAMAPVDRVVKFDEVSTPAVGKL